MPPTYLMLLWHMHQPYYKDLAEGAYAMPWVRLHALKDYYGMVAVLRDFPSVRATFNLVPSLIEQIEDYAHDTAREPAYDVAFKPVGSMNGGDREALLASAFQINHENLLRRYPRFQELWEKVQKSGIATAAKVFTPQEIVDLQVLSQVAWFDEIFLSGDPEVVALVKRERSYRESDKTVLRQKEIELFNVTLEEYRRAAERGQIEISTSPFYHPILPLVCDTAIAQESHPGVRLPHQHFRQPGDARDQLRSAVALHERVFGRRPRGMWPSEGSVSDEVLRLAADEGFIWTATDEGVLGRSRQMGFYRRGDGTLQGGEELYRPHSFEVGGKTVSLFFRDHQLSDLIGFVYSRMDPHAAADDLYHRIKAAGRSTGQRPAVVSVILDGENAWEYYPGNGREFLKAFYGRIAADPDLRAVTASEALKVTEPGTLHHVVPGSWINGNFDVWIGADEDNRSWDMLSDARAFFAQHVDDPQVKPENRALAQRELWIAEGSDWNWWYGPEHSTANDEEFDLLYRKHLSNIYRLLGGSPADELAVPIKSPRVRALTVAPSGQINPKIDGRVTTYFEWLGAGLCQPDYRTGSMHGAAQLVEALYYGYSEKAVYLRVDVGGTFMREHPDFEIRVNVNGGSQTRLHAAIGAAGVKTVEFWKSGESLLVPLGTGDQVQVAFDKIFELQLDYSILAIMPHEQIHLQVSIWMDGLPLQVLPQEGWLALELTEDLASW
ncbi:MAG TPA: glycoside hydrolase family 57 protein [Terriglobia bacterium]|nr:glycoside hydrolase family 57 protein [Terriglobia bacterium]